MYMDLPEYNTIIVNLFAGPGAGKTTCSWEIASELKKRGYITEYVSEVAKEYVWDGKLDKLDGAMSNQLEILKLQYHRIRRLLGKVHVIVTDAPILLNTMYLKEPDPLREQAYKEKVLHLFLQHKNFNIFIQRGNKKYEQQGRIQDLEESMVIDKNIIEYLDTNKIYYGVYTYDRIKTCIGNIETTIKRAEKEPILLDGSNLETMKRQARQKKENIKYICIQPEDYKMLNLNVSYSGYYKPGGNVFIAFFEKDVPIVMQQINKVIGMDVQPKLLDCKVLSGKHR